MPYPRPGPEDAFFVPSGAGPDEGADARETFAATAWARGPWSRDHAHGGPPSALLGRALERAVDGLRRGEERGGAGPDPAGAGAAWHPARVLVSIVRPVPLGAMAPLAVEARVTRAGRQAVEAEATLTAAGKPVARANGLFLRRAALDLPAAPPVWPGGAPPPPPDDAPSLELDFFLDPVGYQGAVDVRVVRGAWGAGPLTLWMRPLAPLLPGEVPSPLQRVLALVDATSGVAPPLPTAGWAFPNPELTVALRRLPEGTWLGLEAEARAEAHGVGLAHARLFDARGDVGFVLEPLLVSSRGTG